ncbi:MAG: quinol dehydrogenase membrane component [Candidatus Bathyarchaeota archaeon BA1]|nr:MAG: quinol dehydrogenase membrane component [Candidatus Bathyarchaeota archaeon BA1]
MHPSVGEENGKPTKGWLKAIIASIGVFVFTLIINMPYGTEFAALYGLVPALCTFALLRAKRITKLRRTIYFIFTFILWFGFDLMAIHERGSLVLPADMFERNDVVVLPCPAAISMIFFGWIIHGQEVFVPGTKVIYPTTYDLFLCVFVITLIQGFLLGRGWCGWSCLFGGFVEACASGKSYGKSVRWRMDRIMKKPEEKADEKTKEKLAGLLGVREEVRDIKWGFLLVICLLSAVMLRPVFCEICPSRVWNDYPNPAWGYYFWGSMTTIFVLFAVFWVVLPFLSRKKLWCHSICPLGAFFGLLGIVSPFQVKIDKEKCNECLQCVRVCKDYAMTYERVMGSGRAALECTRCGRCMDACAKDAIGFYLRGTSRRVRSWFIPLSIAFMFLWLSVFVWAIVTILPAMLGF